MKKYLTLLLMVFGIHVSAGAQHLFPEVTFTYQNKTYIVPAWDAKCAKGERVQLTSESDGIIVATACALPTDGGVPVGDFSAKNIAIGENTFAASEVTYKDIFPEMDETYGAEYLFSKATITGDNYSIPTTTSVYGQYNIIGIGDGAYANKSWDPTDDTVYMQITKAVTIPVQIKSLGKYAFLANGKMFEALPADDSEIKVFPEGVFADCMRMKRVRFPNSLESVESHALGGCNVLRLIYMGAASNHKLTPPTMASDACTKYDGSTANDFLGRKGIGTNQHYCEIWTYDHEAARNCRKQSFWNDFCLRIPSGFDGKNVAYKSFYSDLTLWKYYPVDKGDDNVSMNGSSHEMDFLYYSISETLNPTGGNGMYTIELYDYAKVKNNKHAFRPQSMGLILHGSSEQLYIAPVGIANNIKPHPWQQYDYLYGGVEPIDMDEVIRNNPDDYVFVLKNGEFRRCSGGTLAAYKAYLKLPKSVFPGGRTETAKGLNIVIVDEEGETDGIKAIDNSQLTIENGVVYDLQGRVVSTNGMESLPKGIYIMNGKKFTK